MWIVRRSRITCAVMVSSSGLGKVRATASSAEPRHAVACTRPSSLARNKPICSVANRCWPLSRILSNTGAVSATELLMTCSTSAVAVCCSSASLVSLNSRSVLDRDHGLVGKGLQQRDLLVAEARRHRRDLPQSRADARPPDSIGANSDRCGSRSIDARRLHTVWDRRRRRQHVGELDRPAARECTLPDRRAARPARADRSRAWPTRARPWYAASADLIVAIHQVQADQVAVEQPLAARRGSCRTPAARRRSNR